MSETRQRTADPRVAPRRIFVGELDDELFELALDRRPAARTAAGAIVLFRNEAPIPAQPSVRGDDGGEWMPGGVYGSGICTDSASNTEQGGWQSNIGPTTTEGTTIIPDEYTLPGWSGANRSPLTVSGDQVRLNFNPEGENMRMQLAYWAEDGTAVYSQPVESGELCLNLEKAPKNNVVIAVVSNTDYIYENDDTRWARFDYSGEMGRALWGLQIG